MTKEEVIEIVEAAVKSALKSQEKSAPEGSQEPVTSKAPEHTETSDEQQKVKPDAEPKNEPEADDGEGETVEALKSKIAQMETTISGLIESVEKKLTPSQSRAVKSIDKQDSDPAASQAAVKYGPERDAMGCVVR